MRNVACSFSIASIAFLAGCGGSRMGAIPGAPVSVPQPRAIAQHAPHGKSWMLPEAKRIKRLLYAADTQDVLVFDYDTGRQVGTLTGFQQPYGQCVDKEGDVFLTTEIGSAGAVLEYAHGGSNPIEVFSTAGHPIGCSIAPKTGDLAVANGLPGNLVNVQIWKHASGMPVSYSNENDCSGMWPPGYDDKGDLFVETGDPTSVCELPAEGSSLIKVPFGHGIGFSGSVMWDGKHITFTDQSYDYGFQTAIYRAKLNSDGSLTVVGTTILQVRHPQYYGDTEVLQPFIVGTKNTPANDKQGTSIVGENIAYVEPRLQYWQYPRGATPYKRTREGVRDASEGTSVSIIP